MKIIRAIKSFARKVVSLNPGLVSFIYFVQSNSERLKYLSNENVGFIETSVSLFDWGRMFLSTKIILLIGSYQASIGIWRTSYSFFQESI